MSIGVRTGNPSVTAVGRDSSLYTREPLALRGTGERAATEGRPYAGVGDLRDPTELFVAAVWRRGGTEPAPYTMVEGMRFFRKGP